LPNLSGRCILGTFIGLRDSDAPDLRDELIRVAFEALD
jgi:hypothetical protein